MGLLRVTDLVKYYGGVQALNGVTLQVEEGEILGLIGPNGAGKSTLFDCITGLTPPSAGEVLFSGNGRPENLLGLRPDRIAQRGIARTFQGIRLFTHLTALDNVKIGQHCRTHSNLLGALLRTPGQQREEEAMNERARELLDFVGLSARWAAPAGHLSYGEQRRLEVARALASRPRLLLLDEPAAGMNPRETSGLMELIEKIYQAGVTVMLIEHDMRVVMGISGRIAVLDHGECIATAPPHEIRRDPRVIAAYLGHADRRAGRD